MNFSLIICTYQRPIPIVKLLNSVVSQTTYPNEIVIVDGSIDDKTMLLGLENKFKNVKYFKVSKEFRGLTKQRNFGIENVDESSKIICFLDDDTVLSEKYFEEILKTYKYFPDALGVGGYISNEIEWTQINPNEINSSSDFAFDGYKRKDGSRFILRKKIGLDSDKPPGFMPAFSHGRSIGFLPPSGKIYNVEQLMGGVSSFKKEVFQSMQFSTYFEGYGLYEDADFTLRLAKKGKLYINTKATLEHYHDEGGRPNKYHYGKMVVRNGWYVWRVKTPNPLLKDRIKWNLISLLLISIRATNIFMTNKKKEAFSETIGRAVGWMSLLYSKPSQLK